MSTPESPTGQPTQPPAGWYPAPHANGEMKYWDGIQWTDAAPQPAKKRRRKWPWITLGSVVAFLVLIIIVSSLSGGGNGTPAAAKTAAPPAATSAAPPTPAAPQGTVSQEQALTAAQGYLSMGSGFSKASLLDQLTSSSGNGFSQSDAMWAIDHAGANWKDQALDAAKGYLSMGSGFSYKGLLDQLTSSSGNRFERSDAVWAIEHSGADWNAQAVEAAKGYLSMGGFSRSSLIEQLSSSMGNGFTKAQAEYAANKVGLK